MSLLGRVRSFLLETVSFFSFPGWTQGYRRLYRYGACEMQIHSMDQCQLQEE
jgi:hypothetical protein